MGNSRKRLENWGNITSRESPCNNRAEHGTESFEQFCGYLIFNKIVKISSFYT